MMVMAPHWSQMDVSMAPAAPVTPMEPHIAPPEPIAEPESEEVAEVADVEVKPAKKEPPGWVFPFFFFGRWEKKTYGF